MRWSHLAEWWVEEVESDPAYESVVTPMLIDVLDPGPGRVYLDLGCGEGRVMRSVAASGATVHGIDVNESLARRAASAGPVAVSRLPDLGCLRDHSYDGAYCVLVLEHIEDEGAFFAEVARVVGPGGVLGLVMNHPFWTAPGATAITDSDGEVLWRPGGYFGRGQTYEPAGGQRIVFHHRSMGALLEAAAVVRWSLEHFTEAAHHEWADQVGIPRLLACRWRLLP
jgi:SAM-dependent methyltransferase